MNRLEASPLSPLPAGEHHQAKSTQAKLTQAEQTESSLIKPLFTGGVAASLGGVGLRCDDVFPATTFTPVHYEAGYAYPLLIWLHGDGQTERDLPNVMTHISVRNYVGAAPRGERVTAGARGDARVSGWCDCGEAMVDVEERVVAAIDRAAERFNIRQDRVFLAGVGTGGTAALRVGLANPGRFAGVASFDGPMPHRGRPLRSVTRSRQLPLLLAASRDSTAYPEDHLCRDLRLLHTAGCQVNIRQYPGGDNLTTTMLSDLDKWMMEIVCSGR